MMKRLGPLFWLAAFGLLLAPAEAGHELPIYPSYYPQEIRVEVVDPAQAGPRLADARIHAYVGAEPEASLPGPDVVRPVESLGSYLVLTFEPAFVQRHNREARCAAAARLERTVAAAGHGHLVFHPYPVTPFHPDYLHHFDLAEAAKRPSLSAESRAQRTPAVRVRAEGSLAVRLFGAPKSGATDQWDAIAAEIPAADLVISHGFALNGWLGPSWVKQGWFHALALLRESLTDAGSREAADALAARLERGEYGAAEEQLNLERDLVTRLRSGCERVVLGYTVKREYFNTAFEPGIENIAYDSQTGLDSPLFVRTAKLKDFPWNGWLRLGISTPPRAAWNPVGGFTDPAGRLIWYAVGDPALLPAPYGDGWVLNRIVDVRAEPRR
jgi:hypothetical protein